MLVIRQVDWKKSLLIETCQEFPIKSIEIKISQGAKPGRGGILLATKITPEISRIRKIPMGQDCISPSSHIEFSNADQLLDFVERLASLTGLPVGIKSAVGEIDFWHELAGLMESGDRGVDFITIDGGEGGTGAAPMSFADHVSLPFKIGFSRVYRKFAEFGLNEKDCIHWIRKTRLPHESLLAMAMGCDMINVGREAMLSVGCIQAQICHTGNCPTGVATQSKWLMRGLVPTDKSARLANYLITLRKEILQLCHCLRKIHPSMVTTDSFEILDDGFKSRSVNECFGLQGINTRPGDKDVADVLAIMRHENQHGRVK